MMLTLVGVSYGTLDETARRARGIGADILVRPPASSLISLSSSPMSEKLVPILMKQPHVTFATGTMGQPLGGLDLMTGIDLAQFNRLSGGFRFVRGGPFQNDDDIIVDAYYAREKKLDVGSAITLANHTWRVSGIFESGKLSRICARLNVLQALTGNVGRLSQIYLKVDDPAHAQQIVEQLRNRMPGYFIYTMEEFTSLLSINSVGLLRNFIGVVIGIAVIVGFIVVTMAMYTAVLERTREIGIRKAVGARRRDILTQFLVEAIVVSVLGGAIGIAIGAGLSALIGTVQVPGTGGGAPSNLPTQVGIDSVMLAFFVSAAVGLFFGIYPATRASRLNPIEALRYE